MKIAISFMLVSWLAAFLISAAVPQDFRPYAGSQQDRKAGQDASRRGSQCEVYTTTDSFEKVYAFYKALYKEHVWPTRPPALPSGKEVRWAFFILDGGKDLAHSKYWLKIQRPFIGTVGEEDGEFKDIRDLTAIQTIRKN
jgi:hypothetical protein